jgi:indole-3-glycerol phosphate synthase
MSFLDTILQVKKEEVSVLRKNNTLQSFRDSEYFGSTTMSLKNSVTRTDRLGIIAEIKKASPSKGVLRDDFNFLAIAGIYMENSVDAISVLTDRNFFRGDIQYLNEISKIKTVPLLRKDFIIDEYQIYEAKANGADAVLLIAEALSPDQIKELTSAAREIELEVLLELHNEDQLYKIDFKTNDLIGINNRDLITFNVDINTTLKLSNVIPDNVTIISESGLGSMENIRLIRGSKARGVLAGEYFMKSKSIRDSLKEFQEWCRYES